MFITPAILADGLTHLAPDVELRAKDNLPVAGVRLASGTARFDPSYVFLGREHDFARAGHWPEKALVVAPRMAVADAMNDALTVFERFAGWDAQMSEIIAKDGGLQALIDVSFAVFGSNPMYIVDTAFTTLAWSKQVPPDALDEGWATLTGKGHADPREINLLRNTGTLTVIHEYPSASFFNYPDFRYPAIIAHLRQNGERVASLVILEFASPLTQAHLDLADRFTQVAGLLLMRGSQAGQTPRVPQSSFLLDQLLGNSYSREVSDFHLELLGWRREDRYRIARIRPAQAKGSDDAIARGLNANLLQSQLPDSQSCIYEDSIAVVARMGTVGTAELETRLTAFLEENDQQAGLSCVFDGFAELPAYLAQATAALELGPAEAPRRRLYPYERVAVTHLIQAAAQTADRRAFCHPAALRLVSHDHAHHTEYVRTLRAYLSLDRSLVRSAHALHIHRNTLLYRLERINSLLGIDLDDRDTRLHLLLSCQMAQI